MKFIITTLAFTAIILFTSFTKGEHSIPGCYTSFKAEGLKTKPAETLPDAEKIVNAATAEGNKAIVFTNGYKVAYTNKSKATVITLKVLQANADAFAKDTAGALANMRYLTNGGAASKNLITLHYNGYTIYGINQNSAADKSTRGNFVMFTGNDIIVYITFYTIAGSQESMEDYEGRRNAFLGAYTAHLQNCR